MIKVNNKMVKDFLQIMDEYNEFVFGTDKDIQRQLELCLNTQGYWSGCFIRVYYDKNTKDFSIESRY